MLPSTSPSVCGHAAGRNTARHSLENARDEDKKEIKEIQGIKGMENDLERGNSRSYRRDERGHQLGPTFVCGSVGPSKFGLRRERAAGRQGCRTSVAHVTAALGERGS